MKDHKAIIAVLVNKPNIKLMRFVRRLDPVLDELRQQGTVEGAHAYRSAVKRVAYSLRHHAAFVQTRFKACPGDMVTAASWELVPPKDNEGTHVETNVIAKQDSWADEAVYAAEYEATHGAREEDELPSRGAEDACSCGSTDIIVTPRQTRSSDEGYTLFCACKKCPKRWKISS
jgi:DNA-directed RNA polymerase subunit M/transcription elongation factor TFIIS